MLSTYDMALNEEAKVKLAAGLMKGIRTIIKGYYDECESPTARDALESCLHELECLPEVSVEDIYNDFREMAAMNRAARV